MTFITSLGEVCDFMSGVQTGILEKFCTQPFASLMIQNEYEMEGTVEKFRRHSISLVGILQEFNSVFGAHGKLF